jgi:hypothetical protein
MFTLDRPVNKTMVLSSADPIASPELLISKLFKNHKCVVEEQRQFTDDANRLIPTPEASYSSDDRGSLQAGQVEVFLRRKHSSGLI